MWLKQIDVVQSSLICHSGNATMTAPQTIVMTVSVIYRKEEQAEDVLAIYPFCELVSNYWVLCRRVYNAFLVVHITFMTLFSVYAMPTTDFVASRFHNASLSSLSSSGDAFRPETVPLYGLFLLWPVVICFMELVDVLEFCYRAYSEAARSGRRKKKLAGEDEVSAERVRTKAERLSKLLAMGRILMFGFNYLSNISALAFSASVFAWLASSLIIRHHHHCQTQGCGLDPVVSVLKRINEGVDQFSVALSVFALYASIDLKV